MPGVNFSQWWTDLFISNRFYTHWWLPPRAGSPLLEPCPTTASLDYPHSLTLNHCLFKEKTCEDINWLKVIVIHVTEGLLDCDLSFIFGLAWPKRITAAIKFHNKLQQINSQFRNIKLASKQSLKKEQENKLTCSQASACCSLNTAKQKHYRNPITSRTGPSKPQTTNQLWSEGPTALLHHRQLLYISVNHNTQVRHISDSPPTSDTVSQEDTLIHINQQCDQNNLFFTDYKHIYI